MLLAVGAVLGMGLVYGGAEGVTWNEVSDEVRLFGVCFVPSLCMHVLQTALFILSSL